MATLFKDLSILVVDQGTVLDRIDFNIEMAHQNVKKGNVELNKTLARESSKRATACISCLAVSNVVCLVLILVRSFVWTNYFSLYALNNILFEINYLLIC